MNHQISRYKLGRDSKQRAGLWYNLVRSLVLHGRIVTTHAKAKSIISFVDELVTVGKGQDLNSYRRLLAFLRGDEVAAKKITQDYAVRFKDRNGGFVKVVRLGRRKGDSALESCVMFV